MWRMWVNFSNGLLFNGSRNMSKIKDFYLNQQEQNQDLAAMQEEMNQLNEPDWWVEQDQDTEAQQAFLKTLEDLPF